MYVVSATLVCVIGAVCAAWILAFMPTARHPSMRRLSGKKLAGRVVVACGASVVHGRMSFDWVGDLERRLGDGWSVVNTGRNGRRAAEVRRSIGVALRCEPDVVLVMVGINDVTIGTAVDEYRAELRTIVGQLQPTGARVVLLTLTVVGDDPDGPGVRKQDPYNAVIREIAAEAGIACIDVAAVQSAWLRRNGRAARSGRGRLMLSAVLQRYLLRRSWDQISGFHGLLLTTDLVHQNSVGGGLIADEVVAFLEAEQAVGRPAVAALG